jgi:hypothetical protein
LLLIYLLPETVLGNVGIAFNIHWYEPYANNSEDIAAAETTLQFEVNYALLCYSDCWPYSIYSGTSVYVLNPFQILGLIPERSYTKRIFPVRNKGKMINPFP